MEEDHTHTHTQKKRGRRRKKVDEQRRQKIETQIYQQQAKHAKAILKASPSFTEGTIVRARFSAKGALISASEVPHAEAVWKGALLKARMTQRDSANTSASDRSCMAS